MRHEPWGHWGWVFEWDGPRRRGRRRRRKPFGRGDLKFVMLGLIAERPMHGYEVMKALEEDSRGCYRASPGTVYPILQMLEDQGHLRAEEVSGKRVYHITDEGTRYLEEHSDRVDAIFERWGAFSRRFGEDMGDISRSFSKLAQDAFDGMFRWTGDPSVVEDIKDILDEAAHGIEDVLRQARGGTREGGRRRKRGGRDSEEAAAESEEAAETSKEDGPGASDG